METPKLTKKRISEYLTKGKRFDNRGLLDYRSIVIETNISKNAEGSARVKIGDTEVLVGVKLDAGEPYPDSQEEGVLVTTAELLPLSSPRFEPGPPQIEAIELARIIDRGIRESGFIDFGKLCIKKGEKVWNLFLDIYSINDNGNLLDAVGLAAVAALLTARMPKYDEKEEKVLFGELTNKKLPLTKNVPITMTFHKINNTIFLDPVREEEESSEVRLSISFSNDKKSYIHAVQKGNADFLTKEDIFEIIYEGEKKAKLMHEKILNMIGEDKNE